MAKKGYKTLYFDVMQNGRFIFQMAYQHCELFKLNFEDLLEKVYQKRPTLRDKKIQVLPTTNVLR